MAQISTLKSILKMKTKYHCKKFLTTSKITWHYKLQHHDPLSHFCGNPKYYMTFKIHVRQHLFPHEYFQPSFRMSALEISYKIYADNTKRQMGHHKNWHFTMAQWHLHNLKVSEKNKREGTHKTPNDSIKFKVCMIFSSTLSLLNAMKLKASLLRWNHLATWFIKIKVQT